MAKQTLKSLLGLSDKREQIELDLDDKVFQAPSVSAGNYRVSAPQYQTESAASDLANALGKYAGPIARGIGNIEKERQEEFAEVAKGTPTEILQAISRGDLDPVKKQFEEFSSKLDGAERKKLIKFSENPNNYIRASRVIGDRLASQYQADLRDKLDEYANKKDENGDFIPARDQMNDIAQQLITDNNLSGYSLRAFNESRLKFEAQEELNINTRQDDFFKSEVEYETKSTLTSQVLNDNFEDFGGKFALATQNKTVEEQATFLKEIVGDIVSMDISAASQLVSKLDNEAGFLTIGSGSELGDNLIFELNEMLDAEQDLIDEELKQDIAKTKEDLAELILSETTKLDRGESLGTVTLPLIDSEDAIEIDLSGVKTKEDLYTTINKQYVNNNPDNATRANIISGLDKDITALQTAERDFYEKAGLFKIEADLTSSYTESIEGVNVYGLADSEITSKVAGLTQDLELELKRIYNDPTLDIDQKKDAAILATSKQSRSIAEQQRIDADTFMTTRQNSKFFNSIGLSATNNSLSSTILSSLQATSDLSPMPVYSKRQALEITQPFMEELRTGAAEILNAPLTDEEITSGNMVAVMQNREIAARNYVDLASADFIEQSLENPPKSETEEGEEKPQFLTANSTVELNPYYLVEQQGNIKADNYFYQEQQSWLTNYTKREQQAVKDGYSSFRHKLRTEMKTNDNSFYNKRAFVTKHGFTKRGDHMYYENIATERLYSDQPAITLNEIRAGKIEGHVNITDINATKTVVLSPEIIMYANENVDIIKEYAIALNLKDTSDDTLNAFITKQAELIYFNFKLPIFKGMSTEPNKGKLIDTDGTRN